MTASSAGARLVKCCQCSPFIVHGADAIVRPSSVIHAGFMRDPCVFHARTVRDSYVLHSLYMRRLNVRNCIGFGLVRCCAWNVRSLSVIVSDTCAVYTRFIGDSDHAQPRKMTNFSTNNHAQTNFMRDLCVIYA